MGRNVVLEVGRMGAWQSETRTQPVLAEVCCERSHSGDVLMVGEGAGEHRFSATTPTGPKEPTSMGIPTSRWVSF